MIVITLARKPTGSTVAANVLKWGCGGLNIDQTRIGSGEILTGGGGKLWSHYRDGTEDKAAPQANLGQGRFPANLILAHLAGCQCTGSAQIKGNRTDTRPEGDGGREDRSQWRFRPTDQTKRGYSDPDGKETVQAWDCEEGCPVAGLDEQSGTLGSGSGVRRKAGPGTQPFAVDKGWNQHSMTRDGATAPDDYGDKGGASRFFKQVQRQE